MKKKAVSNNTVSIMLALMLVWQMLVGGAMSVQAETAARQDIVELDQQIAQGIHYSRTQILNYNNNSGIKEKINVLTADLNDPTVNIVSSKAKDSIYKTETVSQQIQREAFKGRNVVAGINADMFSMDSGVPLGLQVQDGNLLIGFNPGGESRFSVFGIDRGKKAFVDFVKFDGQLTVLDAVYEREHGAPNPATMVSIDSMNRNEGLDNRLILETPMLSDTPRVTFSSAQAANGTFTYLEGVTGPIKLGQTYEATVANIVYASSSNPSATVPNNQLILAGHGTKSAWIKEHLKAGDKIRFSFDILDKQGKKLELQQAVSGWSSLVENGSALTEEQLIARTGDAAFVRASDKARTAIGVTSDNRVLAVTVDAGQPSLEISTGLSITDMARLMTDLGAVSALSLDGGGSTQMNARLYGSSAVTVVNKPSDGNERGITNALLLTSSTEKTHELGSLQVEKDVLLYRNTPYQFHVKGADTRNNPVDVTDASIIWGTKGSIGTIDGAGSFVASSEAAQGEVVASVGSVTNSAQVRVVDRVKKLGLTDSGTLSLENNSTKAFMLTAEAENGEPVIIANRAARWSIMPETLGGFNEDGVLATGTEKGKGTVTATVYQYDNTWSQVSIGIAVGQDAMIIDDFETGADSDYSINGYVGGSGAISTEQAKSGSSSYKISYDYNKWTRQYNGTINFRFIPTDSKGQAQPDSKFQTQLRPKKLGMWVYGDGKAPWLRAIIVDGNGQKRTLDVASSIYWTGWKYVDVAIPQDVPLPISLSYIYMVETNKKLNFQGTVYFDDIRFSYADTTDMKGPTFSSVTFDGETVDTIYKAETSIAVSLSDDMTGVEPSSITVTLDKQSIAVNGGTGTASYDADTGTLTYLAAQLAEGTHSFVVEAADRAGNRTNPPLTKTFNVNLQPDLTPPEISGLIPIDQTTVKSPWPKLSFKVKDKQSGVDIQNLHVMLGKQGEQPKDFKPAYYDELSGWGYYIQKEPFEPGTYAMTIQAKDRSGNEAVEKTVTFNIAPFTAAPRDSEHFIFSVTSDSHATKFGESVFPTINIDDSELVLQNGDLVDNDNDAQWEAGANHLAMIKDKPVMISPGNHEGFNGNLTSFMKKYGDPTYSFEYGNSLFISLNSALGQSLSTPDPSQFDYLKQILAYSDKPNVFIFTHNPTRDSFGTAHEMLVSDAVKLEGLLGDYKQSHPSVNVNVIFGHLHVSQSWEKRGVVYTISGDEALKKYVTPENGGYLSYTKFYVDGNAVRHSFFPLVSDIAVQDSAVQPDGTLTIVKGATRSLNVFGDFRVNTADYVINLSKFKDMDMHWTSSDQEIVSVDDQGMIKANRTGTAELGVKISNRTYTQRVAVVDQQQIVPVKLSITPAQETLDAGVTFTFQATATDVFGNSFAVDNSIIQWQATNGIGSITNGALHAVENEDSDTFGQVVATMNGINAKADITVKKKVRTPDTTPPSRPTGLTANAGNGSVTLMWNPNTEADLKGYFIYDGSDDNIFVEADKTSYVVSGLTNGKTYSFEITAVDLTGNQSERSEAVSAIPVNDQAGDTEPPVWESGSLNALYVGETYVKLAWKEAKDNTGVRGYRIYQNGSLIQELAADVYNMQVSGLLSGTAYRFEVEAYDAAGNTSRVIWNGITLNKDNEHSNHSGSGSGTTPSVPIATPLGSGLTDLGAYGVAIVEGGWRRSDGQTPAGKPATILALNDSVISEAAARIKEKSVEAPKINVALPNDQANVIASIQGGSFEELRRASPNAVFVFKTDAASYELPVNLIDVKNGQAVSMVIQRLTNEETAKLADQVKNQDVTLLGNPVDFSIVIEENGSVSQFGNLNGRYVTRSLVVPGTLDANKATGVAIDLQNGTVEFVPTVFRTENGATIAIMKHQSNSVYAVITTANINFADTQKHWAEADIALLSSKLIVQGVDAGRFAPDQAVNRAEFAAMLTRALGLAKGKANSNAFTDVRPEAWYAGYLTSAVRAGIMDGFEDGTFRPDAPITREQLVTMISRAMKAAGKTMANTDSANRFSDFSSIADWAKLSVQETAKAGIVEGLNESTFAPKQTTNRAQAAVILHRLLKFEELIN